MPSKKKSAEAEAVTKPKPAAKKAAKSEPKAKSEKPARAPRKAKKSDKESDEPAVAAATHSTAANGGDDEVAAQAADTFEEAFEERAGEHAHTIDPEKVDAVAASAKKKPAKSSKPKKAKVQSAEEPPATEALEYPGLDDDDDAASDDSKLSADSELDEDDSDDSEHDFEKPRADLPPARQDRLQKILAQAGIASRRHAEEMITEGRVQVNGKVVTELGSKADPNRDHIRVDGKLLHGAERLRYFMLNKPKGYVTTVSDPEGRQTVMEFFQKMGERLYPVGRLDYLSEGLILVTNDGDLANKLTRAASGVDKVYLVKVAGQPEDEAIERLREGVMIERGAPGEGRVRTSKARIKQVRYGENPWFEVILTEGRNRELRKMFEEIGHHVEKIRRVGYGPLELDIEPGTIRELFPEEVEALQKAAEGKKVKQQKRFKTTDMLPKEAGRSVDHDADDRRKGKFRPRPEGDRGRTGAPPTTGASRGASGYSGAGFAPRGAAPSRGFDRAEPGRQARPPRPEGGQRSDRPSGTSFGARRPSAGGFGRDDRGARPQRGGPGTRPGGPGTRPTGPGGPRSTERRDFSRPPRQADFSTRPTPATGGDRGESTAKPVRLHIEEDRGEERTTRPRPPADRGGARPAYGGGARPAYGGAARPSQNRPGQGSQGRSGQFRPGGAGGFESRGGQERRGPGRPAQGRAFGERSGGDRPRPSAPAPRGEGGFSREREGGFSGRREGGYTRGAGGAQGRTFSRPPRDRGAEQGSEARPPRREGGYSGGGDRPRTGAPAGGSRGFTPRPGQGSPRPGGQGTGGFSRPSGPRPPAGRPASGGSRPGGPRTGPPRGGSSRPSGGRPSGRPSGRPGSGRPSGGGRPGGRPSGGAGRRRP